MMNYTGFKKKEKKKGGTQLPMTDTTLHKTENYPHGLLIIAFSL